MQGFEAEEFMYNYISAEMATLNEIEHEPVERATDLIRATRVPCRVVWLIGNGGAASLASHMATDLQLAGVAAQALTDVAAVTTYANDDAFEHVFIRQLQVLAKPGDVLVGISTSGTSPNVLQAFAWAKGAGLTTIGLLGTDTKTDGYVDVYLPLVVQDPHVRRPIIVGGRWTVGVQQDVAQAILHIISYRLMEDRA